MIVISNVLVLVLVLDRGMSGRKEIANMRENADYGDSREIWQNVHLVIIQLYCCNL